MNSRAKEQDQSDATALTTVDMTRVYSLVRAEEAQRVLPRPGPELQLRPLGSREAVLTLSKASAPPPQLELQREQSMLPTYLLKLQPVDLPLIPMSLQRLNQNIYRVFMGGFDGPATPVELDIPTGLPRFVNAATLKSIVGASSSDVVLRKVGERWEICGDAYSVDLQDRTQVFRVRHLEISS
jgi:hypothetical protein